MQAIVAEKALQAQALAAPFKHSKKGTHIEIAPCEMFPQGALMTWCSGHLFEIAEPHVMDASLKKWRLETLPMIPDSFKYKVIPSKASRFKAVKAVLTDPRVNEIIAAGDPAREGELIVRLVIRMSGVKKPMRRLWVNSLTPKAVEKAFQNLLRIESTQPLYFEAMARSYADWLIGMNASRVYTLLIQSKGVERSVYSVGRVQTPTLAMIVNREREIQEFVSKPFFEVVATFNMDGKIYEGKYTMENGTRFDKKEDAVAIQEATNGKEALIAEVKIERKHVQPPAFHSLSTLQALANKRFKFSPKKTLEVTQSLYEKSYVTYPRTDSNHVTKGEAEAFPDIMKRLATLEPYEELAGKTTRSILSDKRYVNEKLVSDHYAIIPTEKIPPLNRLSNDEQKIYDIIARSLIAAHYGPAIFSHTSIQTNVSEHKFMTKGKQLLTPGWRTVIFDDQKEEDALLPDVKEKEQGVANPVKVTEGKTTPPKRFTEGELITAMKNVGQSVEDKEVGKVLKAVSGLGEESTRSNVIERLKQLDYIEIIQHRVAPCQKAFILIDAVKDTLLASPELTGRWEQRLKEIGQGEAPPKNFIDQSKKLAEKLVQDAIQQSASWDMTQYKAAVKADQQLGPCPICGAGVVDKGRIYGCSAYKTASCKFILTKKLLGKSLSETNVKKLLDKGKTNLIKGFKGKKTFDAYIVWQDKREGSIQFEFKRKRERVKK
ncbi:type IA DNA topoisomerase [Lederbergia citrea]|uniref:type IA DNA topoisomerase n=1 Tax=Lederbergia citrea TaxID=2833581 RepID=UPI001BC9CC6E|nr:type IA DNA topoisomerase [Lederbergia citrea]MBS4178966.1 DNA topoisomerase 3 [Lederbergia citrea]